MTELPNVQIKAKAYFAKDPAVRTRQERKEFLKALGVEHPGHFLASVWFPAWEEAVDEVLDPRSSHLRPLKPTDFHFKWAVGAINLLPLQTRLNVLSLKMKPTGLEAAIRGLLAKAGHPEKDFVVEDLEVLRFIHSEYSIKLRTADSQQLRVEVSHYLPVAEEIFHRFAELFQLPVTTIYVDKTPRGEKYVLELEEPDRVELSEVPPERLALFADKIVERVALHDALGDVLGTIMRDPHYLLSAAGELYSFHHYQLFLDMDDDHFGFFLPVFAFLGEELGNEKQWYEKYRTAYIKGFAGIKDRADEVLQTLEDASDIINEYLGSPGEFPMIRAGVEERLGIDPVERADKIGELFSEQSPTSGGED